MFDAVLCLAANIAGKCVSLQRVFVSWLIFFCKEGEKKQRVGPDLLLDMKTFSFLGLKNWGGKEMKAAGKNKRRCDCVYVCVLVFESGLLANSFVTHLGPLVFL